MAISPIGRTPPQLSSLQPRGIPSRPAAPPVTQPQANQVHQIVKEDGGLVPTYSVIRIDESDRVSVKIMNAETDEVILEYPPASLTELGNILRQAAEPSLNRDA